MDIWNSKILDSMIKKENVAGAEIICGYLIGPALVYLMTCALSGTYLVQFYTDVIGIGSTMIVVMPIISKLLAGIANVLFSALIDRKETAQGKARPWLLISGVILPFAGLLLYGVPHASMQVKMLWILFSYNFFFVIAYNIYTLSHTMLLPRSTRVVEDRDKLSLFKNIAESMIPGTLSSVIMPFIVKGIGVGEEAQGRWLSFMAILSAVAVPGALIEYYFTKERVSDQKKHVRFWEQLKESLKYKEWLIILAIIALKALDGSLTNNVMIYYCNWVAGSSVSEGAKYQALLNVIGQFPLGIGVILLWPIMRKYGKYNVMRIGFLIGIVGCLIMVFSPGNFYVMLVGMFLKSIGSIPTTMSISFLSDVIDRIERKTGYRFDSLGASINSMIQNITLGAAQTALLLGVNRLGYIVPSNSEQVIQQPQIVRSFFSLCMTGVPLICFILCFALINILSKKVEEKKD